MRDGGVRFTGTVAGTDKPVVVGAEVNVNGLIAVTNQYGAFKLEVPEAGRYVLNVHKTGYAENSKIYDRGIAGGKWTLVRASVSTVDPKQPIKLVNKRIPSDCPGPLTGQMTGSVLLRSCRRAGRMAVAMTFLHRRSKVATSVW